MPYKAQVRRLFSSDLLHQWKYRLAASPCQGYGLPVCLLGALVREIVLSFRSECEAGLEILRFEEATWLSNLMKTGLALAPTLRGGNNVGSFMLLVSELW